MNPILFLDGYKTGHRIQYPEGTTFVYSNLTPRKSIDGKDEGIIFFGLQAFLIDFFEERFNKDFFQKDKATVLSEYERRMRYYLGENNGVGIQHIADLHDLGYLPIRIKALKEGSFVPYKTPVLTIENTLPEFFWLVNYLETIMSTELWLASTSATTAFKYKKILSKYAKETASNEGFILFQGHDFSMRGMAGLGAAISSGMGHLTSFAGTDTLPAIDGLEKYYQANVEKELIGVSVPATEHAVMCMGTKEDEIGTFKRLITELYPNGIISIVSDTWDLWKVLNEYAPSLKDIIMNRDGKVVFRPDSGDPVKIICGDPNSSNELERLGAVEVLWNHFGGIINDKGYKELDSHVGLIYGDSITPERAEAICSQLKDKGFASTNCVFGIGSYSYNYKTRDSHGFAVKATFGIVNSEQREIFKDPITDKEGFKKSAKGIVKVMLNEKGLLEYKDQVRFSDTEDENNMLKEVYCDGRMTNLQSISEVRDKVNSNL